MTEVADYLNLGVNLVNKHTDLNTMFAGWPVNRTVLLRICRPHPEVASLISQWLVRYTENKLVDGAVAEEIYALFLETSGPKFQLQTKVGSIENPTSEIFITEETFWDLAARLNTLYTAFITGRPLVLRSNQKYDLRDLVHMDKILAEIHQQLDNQGINIASIVR